MSLSSTFNRRLPGLLQDKQTRAQLLAGAGLLAGIGAGIAAYAYLREPLQVRLDRLTITLPNARGHLPAAGLRILHLSDTHFQGADWREQAKMARVIELCAPLEYDLLIHTGDFLQTDRGLPNVLTLLDRLPRPRLGAYAVLGNHDYSVYSHDQMVPRAWAKFQELHQANRHATPATPPAQRSWRGLWRGLWRRLRSLYDFGHYFANAPLDLKRSGRNDVHTLEAALRTRGIHLLHNTYTRLTHLEAGVDIYLAGIDDLVEGKPALRHALQEIPYEAPTILLSHNPDILGEPGMDQVDLLLSGHTHGGQIVLPFLGPAHTQTRHLRRHEVAGYLRRGKTQVYITRGIGEGIPLRLGAMPQVTLLTVRPAPG